jgi:hypothetical protein
MECTRAVVSGAVYLSCCSSCVTPVRLLYYTAEHHTIYAPHNTHNAPHTRSTPHAYHTRHTRHLLCPPLTCDRSRYEEGTGSQDADLRHPASKSSYQARGYVMETGLLAHIDYGFFWEEENATWGKEGGRERVRDRDRKCGSKRYVYIEREGERERKKESDKCS